MHTYTNLASIQLTCTYGYIYICYAYVSSSVLSMEYNRHIWHTDNNQQSTKEKQKQKPHNTNCENKNNNVKQNNKKKNSKEKAYFLWLNKKQLDFYKIIIKIMINFVILIIDL